MKNHQKIQKPGGLGVRVLFAVIAALILTVAFAPEVAKPLLVKYYRSIYSAEVVRHS